MSMLGNLHVADYIIIALHFVITVSLGIWVCVMEIGLQLLYLSFTSFSSRLFEKKRTVLKVTFLPVAICPGFWYKRVHF